MVTWEVLDERGLLVRSGEDVSSPVTSRQRLAKGALVRQIQVKGNRLQYELISGSGPAAGWVAILLKDRELLTKRTFGEENSFDEMDTSGVSACGPSSEAHGLGFVDVPSGSTTAPTDNIPDITSDDKPVLVDDMLKRLPPLQLTGGFWRFDDRLPLRTETMSRPYGTVPKLSESMLDGALPETCIPEALDIASLQSSSHIAQQQHERSLQMAKKNTGAVMQRFEQSMAVMESRELVPGKTPKMPIGADTYVHHESAARDLVPNGSTLISDGLAGVGLVQAAMLVERGNQHLTLASKRDAVSKEAQPFWETLKNSNAVLVHKRVGVADHSSVNTLFPAETHVPPIGRRTAA